MSTMLNTCKNSAFKIIKKNIFSIRMTWKSNKYIIYSIDRDINRKKRTESFCHCNYLPLFACYYNACRCNFQSLRSSTFLENLKMLLS